MMSPPVLTMCAAQVQAFAVSTSAGAQRAIAHADLARRRRAQQAGGRAHQVAAVRHAPGAAGTVVDAPAAVGARKGETGASTGQRKG